MRVTWFSMYLLDLEGHVEKTSNPFGDRARREKTGEARIYNCFFWFRCGSCKRDGGWVIMRDPAQQEHLEG